VEKLVLIDASVYAEGTGNLATLPRAAAYAGVSISPTLHKLLSRKSCLCLFQLDKFMCLFNYLQYCFIYCL